MPQSDAFRNSLLLLQQQQRATFTRLIEQTEAALAADWQRGPALIAQYYAPLIDEYAKALAALRLAEDNPAATLSLDWLTSRNTQLNVIEQSVRYSLDQYGHDAQQLVTNAQQSALDAGLSDAAQLTQRSLWPAVEGAGVPPAMLFNRPNPDALAAWVGRSSNGHPLGDLFSNFGAEAASQARKEMLLGMALGANPKTMAAGIANALGISRSRATIIARTEVLGSYRAAQMETYRANSDVVSGWLWSAGGANPCAACMGMDGLQFSLEEELIDHPCGRCAALPITKSWDDILSPLGIDASDMSETSLGEEDAYFGGEDRFNAMSPAEQRAIIGTNTGYEAWRRGEVSLRDFAGRRADGMIYQKSLRELQIPTRQSRTLVEPSPRIAGPHRARDRGQVTPLEQMPAWARQSEASRNVYQILRNGLPYDLMSHEQGLLITNLEQMLREDLPVNVRAAVERQLQMMGQAVERQTVGEAAQTVEEALAQDVAIAYIDAADAANAAQSAVTETEDATAAAKDLSQRDLERIIANREVFTDPNTGRTDFWTSELNGESYFIRPAYGEVSEGSALTSLADRVGLGDNFVKVQTVQVDGTWYEVQPLLEGHQFATMDASDNALRASLSTDAYLSADERMKVSLFTSLLGDDDRMANNMWITPDDKLLQIDYGNIFKPGLPAPYGDLLRPIDFSREGFAVFQALNDAPVVSETVMEWLRMEVLSSDTRQAIMDEVEHLGTLGAPGPVTPYQMARLEAYARFAELPGTPNLGELRKILGSEDIQQLLRALMEEER